MKTKYLNLFLLVSLSLMATLDVFAGVKTPGGTVLWSQTAYQNPVTLSSEGVYAAVLRPHQETRTDSLVFTDLGIQALVQAPRRAFEVSQALSNTQLAFSRDNQSLAVVTHSRVVSLLDAVSGRRTLALMGHTGPVTALAYGVGPGFPVVLSGSKNGEFFIWDVSTGQPHKALFQKFSVIESDKSPAEIIQVGFLDSPRGIVYVLTSKGLRYTFRLQPLTAVAEDVIREREGLENIAAIQRNTKLVKLFEDRVQILSAQGEHLLAEYSRPERWPHFAVISPDETQILIAYSHGIYEVRDLMSGALLLSEDAARYQFRFSGFSDENKNIVLVQDDASIIVRENVSGRVVFHATAAQLRKDPQSPHFIESAFFIKGGKLKIIFDDGSTVETDAMVNVTSASIVSFLKLVQQIENFSRMSQMARAPVVRAIGLEVARIQQILSSTQISLDQECQQECHPVLPVRTAETARNFASIFTRDLLQAKLITKSSRVRALSREWILELTRIFERLLHKDHPLIRAQLQHHLQYPQFETETLDDNSPHGFLQRCRDALSGILKR